jgi:hypothetical protein
MTGRRMSTRNVSMNQSFSIWTTIGALVLTGLWASTVVTAVLCRSKPRELVLHERPLGMLFADRADVAFVYVREGRTGLAPAYDFETPSVLPVQVVRTTTDDATILDVTARWWVPISVLSVTALWLPLGLLRRAAVKRIRSRRHLCPGCGYSLRGNVSGSCPECGAAVGDAGRHESKSKEISDHFAGAVISSASLQGRSTGLRGGGAQ